MEIRKQIMRNEQISDEDMLLPGRREGARLAEQEMEGGRSGGVGARLLGAVLTRPSPGGSEKSTGKAAPLRDQK